MSEEILKALMQLFAIVAKQDDGASMSARKFVEEFLYQQLNEDLVLEYMNLYDSFVGPVKPPSETPVPVEGQPVKKKRTSVKDSAITIGITQKINKTLTQKQKVIVLVRLFELIAADHSFTDQRMELLYTVADAFNFDMDEFAGIRKFVTKESHELADTPEIMLIDEGNPALAYSCKHIHSELDGSIIILKVKSSDLYFLRFSGGSEIYLNGLPINPSRIYLFASGSTIKVPAGKPIFYSDVIAKFLADDSTVQLSFNAKELQYRFPNGKTGLNDINISEGAGKLIGIMGASGAGKTTLLNVLAGIEKPSGGAVLLNGINIHTDKDKIKSVLGYIPQDDLLIEELTVFENLYFSARLCFRDLEPAELLKLIAKTLTSLGLFEIKDLKVGSPLDKKISGGQRKRLNIALELIREPAVLFVDEPTSGLSSRDSENVMDLLRELTLKGKLIFVVIHQPSSDIYKMFDKIIFLDVGGYLIYYGNPVEAVTYFKKADMQVNADVGDCPVCGNVNPELIFNIIEAKMVDDYGRFTPFRKVLPKKWKEHFEKNIQIVQHPDLKDAPPSKLRLPGKLKQLWVYTQRDFKSKINNRQYMVINLLETPLLAFVLSFIIRYIAKTNSSIYIFKDNDNIPAYIFMSIIVMLFIGLSVSAEEIFRDRKILRREALLSLSRRSYLFSKLFILFSLSAIQALMFVGIGNTVIGIKGMYFDYWLVMFTMSCFANVLGLNISATFNSAVAIYILIPILIIPQMILGGAMFNYQKLNKIIGGGYRVPLVAEVMTARWGYEALMVNQFVNNEYEKKLYETERSESKYNYKQSTYLSELKGIVTESKRLNKMMNSDSARDELRFNLGILKNELGNEELNNKQVPVSPTILKKLDINVFDPIVADSVAIYIKDLTKYYNEMFTVISAKKDFIVNEMNNTPEKEAASRQLYNDYYNKYLADLVKMSLEQNKVVREEGKLTQVVDPIFQLPPNNSSLNFRAHFFAPKKQFAGQYYNTLGFNVAVTWVFSILLYLTLYYEVFKKLVDLKKKKKEE